MQSKWTKKISFLLVMVMTLGVMLTGCGSSKPADEANAPAGEKEEFVVGFAYSSAAKDGGYSQVHDEARLYVEEQLKELGVKTIWQENVPENQECEAILQNMIDQGAKIIFANSFGHMDFVEKVAKANPEVKFMHCSGFKMGDNMSNYFGRMYQARYLTGIVAGMQTETNKVGYVAAMAIPEVIRGINAFALGVQSVNPEATVQVTWTNTWYDPAKEKEAAKALIDKGADVIAQHQNTAGAQIAAEEAGVYGIGYNLDMSSSAPNGSLTAAVWNWGPYYKAQVEAAMNGTWKAESYWGPMADQVVDIAPFGPAVTEETKTKVAEAKDGILAADEEIIFVGPLKDQTGAVRVEDGVAMTDDQLLSMDWFVQGVDASL